MLKLYHGYIDDSADSGRKQLIICGAILGDRNEWGMLNGKWHGRLGVDGIEYFKSSHCETLNGQFHKFRQYGMEEGKRRALAIRDDLYGIIENSPVMGLGVALSVPFHEKMRSDSATFGAIPEVPYRLAFQQVLAECGKAMLLLGPGRVVTFGHDNGDDFHVLHDLFKEFKRLNPIYQDALADFVPLDDKIHPPVQAADVSAWTTFQHIKEFGLNPQQLPPKRITSRFYKIVNWLDAPLSPTPDFSADEAPAKAIYAA